MRSSIHKTAESMQYRACTAYFILIFLVACLLAGCSGNKPLRSVFPKDSWEHIAPERVGFHPDKLNEFVEFVGGSGCVIRHGYFVHGWGYYAHPLDVASAGKTVYAHLTYMSIKNGVITGLDEPVVVYEPKLSKINAPLAYKDKEITWRHLVTQTACYGVEEKPGTAFNYSDYQMALLIDTLVFKVHEVGYDVADDKLFGNYLAKPLQFQDGSTINSEHSHPGRLRISARDFARFGLLYLNRGKWGRHQLVPRQVAVQAVTTPLPADLPRTKQVIVEMIEGQRSIGSGPNQEGHLNSYSYTWWLNGLDDDGELIMPDLPADAFLANGHAGHDALLVIPSLDLVVCWINGFPKSVAYRFSADGHNRVNSAGAKLIEALTDPSK